MDNLDETETLAELLRDADTSSSELKFDSATTMSINIAATIHANLLFKESLMHVSDFTNSPPQPTCGQKSDLKSVLKNNQNMNAKTSTRRHLLDSNHKSLAEVPLDGKTKSYHTSSCRKEEKAGTDGAIEEKADCEVTLKRKADNDITRNFDGQLVQPSSARNSGTLTLYKVHSDPEKLGKPKFLRVGDGGIIARK